MKKSQSSIVTKAMGLRSWFVVACVVGCPTYSRAQTPTPKAGPEAAAHAKMAEHHDASTPFILHAEAQLAEIDGKTAEAVALLKQAHALAPAHAGIANDLARLDPNAVGVAAKVATADTPSTDKKIWAVRARLAGQSDSNVTLLPEAAATGEAGYRLQATGNLTLTPKAGPGDMRLGLTLQTSPHLNNRDVLALYDASVAGLTAGYSMKWGRIRTSLELYDTYVLIDGFSQFFLNDAGARLEVLYGLKNVSFGVYGQGGMRFFGHDDGTIQDRDGAAALGGAKVRVGNRRLSATLQAGWQLENTDGEAQKESGLTSGVVLRASATDKFGVSLGANYDVRTYDAEATDGREDKRFTALASATFAVNDRLGVVAGYSFIRNNSIESFDYTRQIAQVGVEASW